MKTNWLWFGCCLFLAAPPCLGADAGIVTIVDGNARLLRGTTWFRLAEGARFQEGDIIDAAEGAEVQVELTGGGSLSVSGPTALYGAALALHEGKQIGSAEFFVARGWLKLVAKPPGPRLRVRAPLGTIAATDAIAVVHAAADAIEVFIESGSARLAEPGKGSAEGATREVRGGEFSFRTSGRSFEMAGHAPQKFVAAMPRQFMDPVPNRAAKFKVLRIELVADREVTYAEAQPWLAGPYRKGFVKRFEPRLGDPAFRAAADANIQSNPEWRAPQQPAAAAPKAEAPKVAAPKAEEPKAETRKENTETGWRWPFSWPRKQ